MDEMDKAIRANERAGRLLTVGIWLMVGPVVLALLAAVVIVVWLL